MAFHFRRQRGRLCAEFFDVECSDEAHGFFMFGGSCAGLFIAALQRFLSRPFRGDGLDVRFEVGGVRADVACVDA